MSITNSNTLQCRSTCTYNYTVEKWLAPQCTANRTTCYRGKTAVTQRHGSLQVCPQCIPKTTSKLSPRYPAMGHCLACVVAAWRLGIPG